MTNLVKLSKFIALVLRHKAKDYNLSMDENGFVDVSDLLIVIGKEFDKDYSYRDIETIVSGDKHGKKRYEIVNGKIRAMFGHGNNLITIAYPTVTPPQQLYHGTNVKAINSIKLNGIVSQNRQYVHLTTNYENASRVAKRHHKPTVILIVKAREAYNDGLIFHQPEEEHFLCEHVSPEYIIFD